MVTDIFCDAATLADIEQYGDDPSVQGFTTNPSLMRKAGITDYREFAKQVLKRVGNKPVSFEVLADDFPTMESQAREIASWGPNVWVKIPITNTNADPSIWLIQQLGDIKINLTAVMTPFQGTYALDFLKADDILSIFVGRITDTGVSPVQALAPALGYQKHSGKKARILWASAREVYNYYQAEQLEVDIITLTPDLIAKQKALRNKDLDIYSLETVRMFFKDGQGITL